MDTFGQAQAMLAAVRSAIDLGTTPSADRYAVVSGAPAWDGCCPGGGQLTVALVRMFGSDVFPVDAAQTAQAGCCPALTVVQMAVLLIRCAPTPDDNGRPPSPAELTASAQVVMTDAELLYYAVSTQLETWHQTGEVEDFNVAEVLPVGPDGGCVGNELTYFTGVARVGA